MWRHTFCEVCGEEMMYRVESGECLCGSCLVERRAQYRVQTRPARQAAFLAKMEVEHAERRAALQAVRDFEGDVDAVDLARDGYFDVWYEEYVGSETVGPKPRWVVESTYTDHVQVRPDSLLRAIFCLIAGRTIPFILRGALRNAKIQLDEAWVVSDGFRDFTDMYDGTDDRDMGDDVMSWIHRDQSDKAILSRWNRPDDELEFMDEIRESGRESEWWELMVDFRRRKLDALLKDYFGLDDYRASMIVLKWEKSESSGRWKPAQQMNVVDWVKWSCEQSGSILGGLQSCTRSIQVKTQLRNRKDGDRRRAKAQA